MGKGIGCREREMFAPYWRFFAFACGCLHNQFALGGGVGWLLCIGAFRQELL